MYTFKDVHIIGVWCGRTRAKELKKVKERKKKIMETKGEEDEQRVRL